MVKLYSDILEGSDMVGEDGKELKRQATVLGVTVTDKEKKDKSGTYKQVVIEADVEDMGKRVAFFFISELREVCLAYTDETDNWKDKPILFGSVLEKGDDGKEYRNLTIEPLKEE